MDARSQACAEMVEFLLNSEAYKATKFLDNQTTVKVTQRRYKGKLPRSNKRTMDLIVTIGKPNYEERKFIKRFKQQKQDITGFSTAKYVNSK